MEVKQHADDKIMEAFKKGDENTFTKVHDLFYHQLRFFAFKMLNSEEDAQDIVSQVFLKLWDRHANFETLANIKAFLFITTRNYCLNWLRNDQRERKREDLYNTLTNEQVTNLLDQMDKVELFERIYKALESLPERQKSILKLFYIEGASLLEIAVKLKIEIGAAKMMKSRALGLLRDRLKNRGLLALVLFLL